MSVCHTLAGRWKNHEVWTLAGGVTVLELQKPKPHEFIFYFENSTSTFSKNFETITTKITKFLSKGPCEYMNTIQINVIKFQLLTTIIDHYL